MPDLDKNMFHIEGRVKNVIEKPRARGIEYKIIVEVDGTASDGEKRNEKTCYEITARGSSGNNPWPGLARNKLYAFDGAVERERDDGRDNVLLATGAHRIKKVNHGRARLDDKYMRSVEWYDEEGHEPPLWFEKNVNGACG